MHKHNFGQILNLQRAVVTLNIRSRSSKSNKLFSVSKQCIYASLMGKASLFGRQSSEKADFTGFSKDGDLEN